MKKHELCVFILKMLGIFAIIQALPLIQNLSILFVVFDDYRDSQKPIWFYVGNILPFFFYVCIIILLLVCSNSIARLIIKNDDVRVLADPLTSRELQAISFSVMGVIVFLMGLPRLCNFVITLWQIKSQHFNNQEFNESLVRSLRQTGISVVIQCGLATFLFFGSRGLANFWHRIQIARYVKINDVEKNDESNNEK